MYLLIKHSYCSHCLLLSFSSEDEEARSSHSLSSLPWCCAAAQEPLGLSPSRCLPLPDTEHWPLCCYFKNVILSEKTNKQQTNNKQQKKPPPQHGISKMLPGNGLAESGTVFHPVPLIYQHSWTHTTYQNTHQAHSSQPLCCLLGSPVLIQPVNHKHFYLSGTKL